MSQADMVNFDKYIMPAIAELYPQMINKFNEASAGTISLTSEGFEGDYNQASFYQQIFSAGRRVNRYGSNDVQAPTPLTQAKHSSVKVAGGFGPVLFEPSQMTWLRKPTQEGVTIAAQQFAQYLLADQLNTAILALTAAIGNNTDLVVDVSAGAAGAGAISLDGLNQSHAKFADHSQNLVGQVMSGIASHKLIGEGINNKNRLFTAGNVTVYDVLGKRSIVTDSPALRAAGTPNLQKILSLVAGAGAVSGTSDVLTNISTTNGKQRIETTLQTDYTFGLGLKGYTWDETNGGKSPTDALIGTGTNWDKIVSDNKHTAGVMLIADEAQTAGQA